MSKEAMKLGEELGRIRSILRVVTGFEDDDQQYVDDASDAIQRLIESLAEQPAQHPKAKAIAECLAVLRPAVKGKFPHEQALEELVGYIAAPQPEQPQESGRNHWEDGDVFERIAAMKNQPAQQQGPICKLFGTLPVYDRAAQQEPFTHYRHYDNGLQDWADEKTIPLYTSPLAQRPWVGLTDEQWQIIADTLGCIITREQKDAIEAKLKEKNA